MSQEGRPRRASPSVLVVEDEQALAESLVDLLCGEGYDARWSSSLAEARHVLEQREVHLVLLDLALPDGSGLDLFADVAPSPQGPIVVVLTADSSLPTTVTALSRGAYDYLAKPFELETLLHRVEKALDHHEALTDVALRERLERLEERRRPFVRLKSEPMARLHAKLLRVATHDHLPILVRGETGVGKEQVCRLVHELSPRARQPFVAVNCATFDRSLLQSELFGHERGAFTDARERRRGLFELARTGTLMLDEVTEMPPEIQASFLRVLESGRFRRLGGSAELTTNARVVAATNAELEKLVEQGRFRRDLMYRLNAVELYVPPLRDRPQDCRVLADHFCARIAAVRRIRIRLAEDTHEALAAYPWPGNVRELKNVIERTALIHGEGVITARDLDLGRSAASAGPPEPVPAAAAFPTLAEMEMAHVRRALELAGGNRTRAAKLLGVARSTLIRKLEALASGSAD